MNPYLNINRLEFILTDRCTGLCKHCSVGNRVKHPRGTHVRQEAAVRAIRELKEIYDVQSVMTFGGEPLLYPEVTCAIHRAAADCGIPKRQLITNGFFSRDILRIGEVAQSLAAAGVNDLLISADGFHQATIPVELVRCFARAVKAAGIENARFSPAWVVKEGFDCPENTRTRAVLAQSAEAPSSSWWDHIRYFSRAEFACKCGGRYCSGFPAEPQQLLVRTADELRAHFGAAVTVSSGLRCKQHNANCGGVAASRHLSGKAMDFRVAGKTASEVLEYVKQQPQIRYAYAINANYVHMDIC